MNSTSNLYIGIIAHNDCTAIYGLTLFLELKRYKQFKYLFKNYK